MQKPLEISVERSVAHVSSEPNRMEKKHTHARTQTLNICVHFPCDICTHACARTCVSCHMFERISLAHTLCTTSMMKCRARRHSIVSSSMHLVQQLRTSTCVYEIKTHTHTHTHTQQQPSTVTLPADVLWYTVCTQHMRKSIVYTCRL